MPIFSPNQYLLGPGGWLVPPIAYFEGTGLKQNMFCMPLKKYNKFFKGTTTKKHHFSRENGQKNANFWPKSVFSGCEW